MRPTIWRHSRNGGRSTEKLSNPFAKNLPTKKEKDWEHVVWMEEMISNGITVCLFTVRIQMRKINDWRWFVVVPRHERTAALVVLFCWVLWAFGTVIWRHSSFVGLVELTFCRTGGQWRGVGCAFLKSKNNICFKSALNSTFKHLPLLPLSCHWLHGEIRLLDNVRHFRVPQMQ